MGSKITKELHAEVRESLKTMGIISVAKKHNLSYKTVSRIKRGRTFLGYKSILSADHAPTKQLADLGYIDDMELKPQMFVSKPSLWSRLKGLRVRG